MPALGVLSVDLRLHYGQFTLRANQCHLVGCRALLSLLDQLIDTGLLLTQVLDTVGNLVNLCDQAKECGVLDLSQIGIDIVLKPETPGDERGQCHGHQNPGELGFVFFQPPHQADCQNSHGQSWQVGIAPLAQYTPEINQKLTTVGHRQAKQLTHLRHGDDQRRSIGKANDHRVGKKIYNHPEF